MGLHVPFGDLNGFARLKGIGGEKEFAAPVVGLGDDLACQFLAILELDDVGLVILSHAIGRFEDGLEQIPGGESVPDMGQIGADCEPMVPEAVATATKAFIKEFRVCWQ